MKITFQEGAVSYLGPGFDSHTFSYRHNNDHFDFAERSVEKINGLEKVSSTNSLEVVVNDNMKFSLTHDGQLYFGRGREERTVIDPVAVKSVYDGKELLWPTK